MSRQAFRIPLGGAFYTARAQAVNASNTASGYIGVGIVGLMVVGATTAGSDKDARYINCFAHRVRDDISGKTRIYTVKRPGFGVQSTPAAGEKGYAVIVWTGAGLGTDVISAFGEINSTIYNGTISLGAITGQATSIAETFVSATPTLLVPSADNTAWYYDTGVGVMTRITDADFPGNAGKTLAGGFAVMDGFAAIATEDGLLYASDLNSVTGWTANAFDAANAYPDRGVAAVRHKNFILFFGRESLQFWHNAGLVPFPFAKATSMSIRVGCVSASAIGNISDVTFWVGSTPQGGLSVFQFDGAVGRLSTPEVDSVLILAGASNISLTTIRFYGLSFVLVKAGATTLSYCIEDKFWFEWTSTTPLWYRCAASSIGGTMLNYAVSNVSPSGKVYLMNHASLVFTDDGTTYTARAQLPPMDFGTDRIKTCSDITIIGDREATASPLSISYSDDDFQSYYTHSTVDLAEKRPHTTRLGSFRRRGWSFTHAAATPMRIEAIEGNVEIGT